MAHLERMMVMDGLDPVPRATAIQLHECWQRVAAKIETAAEAPVYPERIWH